jgi:hypothetical protein
MVLEVFSATINGTNRSNAMSLWKKLDDLLNNKRSKLGKKRNGVVWD